MKSSDFSEGKMWGFNLARRVAKGHKWHPSNDDLRGTASYGAPPTDPKSGPTGTMQWDYNQVQYFMFSTGDFSEWYVLRRLIARHLYQRQYQRACLTMHLFLRCRMIMKRDIIDAPFGSAKPQEILCSSDYSTPKSYNQYYRSSAEDPWLSYHHHGTSSMMYGENCKYAMFKTLWSLILHCLTLFVYALCSAYGGHSENVLKDGMNVNDKG